MLERDCYEILGISKEASEMEIKLAYKQLAKIYHPDHNPETKEKFIEINKAYQEALNPKLDNSFFNLFGMELWEDLIKIKDFEIPPIDYNELAKAEKEMIKLEKIYNTNGKILEKEIKERFEKEVKAGIRNKYYGREFFKECAKLETHINYFKARTKYYEIQAAPYKQYNWAKNKMKLLGSIYLNFKIENNHLNYILKHDIVKDIIKETINHLKKVLNKESIERMPKVFSNTLNMPIWNDNVIYEPNLSYEENREYFDHMHEYNELQYEYNCVKTLIKESYIIRNQFHPKFLTKLPMKAQIFVHNKIKNLIQFLENELEKSTKGDGKK